MITQKNTDKELFREVKGDYYSPSLHVTKNGLIGIDVGGSVHVMSLREWHKRAESFIVKTETAHNSDYEASPKLKAKDFTVATTQQLKAEIRSLLNDNESYIKEVLNYNGMRELFNKLRKLSAV